MYLGSAAGLSSAYLFNRHAKTRDQESMSVVDALSKTDRLAGMDWRPPTRTALINKLKGFDPTGSTKLAEEEARFDLLIVGGGATGTGCALDAASRGLKVACVEKGDFACGTQTRWPYKY